MLRPAQTVHAIHRKFYDKEVFRSDKTVEHVASLVLGKCCVLYIKDYIRGRPMNLKLAEQDYYLCESRYLFNARRIEKIKNWKMVLPISAPAEPELKLFPTPMTLNKVPSPFYKENDQEDADADMEPDESSIGTGEDDDKSISEYEGSESGKKSNRSNKVIYMILKLSNTMNRG
jgi:hypothetical protein